MIGQRYNTLDSKGRNTFNSDGEEEKNYKKKGAYLSNTFQVFSPSKRKVPEISYFTNFPGFFNKKFNLTVFRKEREDSRSKSRSPEKIINPHKLKGNGIPKDIIERIKFLGKIFDSAKFKKFMKLYGPNKNNNSLEFDEISQKILRFSKKNTQLEGIMMAYYFICNSISYDYSFLQRNDEYKKSQSIENVFKYKRALALGFTNLFEALMRKLDVKCKHIEGYCKILPDRAIYAAYNDNNNNNNSSLFKSNSSNYNSLYKEKDNKNSSIVFTMYNNSSTIRNQLIETSKILSKFNFYNDFEVENDLSGYVNHCWNAIYYKNEWFFVDTVLGSCNFDKNKIKKSASTDSFNEDSHSIYNNNEDDEYSNFNPYYFMAPPEYLINSHLPGDDSWQMTKKFCTLKQFLSKKLIDYGKFYKGLNKYDVELLTHQNPFIQINIKENLVIQLKIVSFLIEAHLYEPTGMHKISEVKFSADVKNGIFTLEPVFPKIGEYLLRMNIRAINSTDIVYKPLFDYVIRVTNKLSFNHFEKYKKMQQFRNEKLEDNLLLPKIGFSPMGQNAKTMMTFSQGRIITDYNKIFPSKTNKIVCYDSEGFVLLEPRTVFIRKGMITKFKVRIRNAYSAFILDGNKLTPLKKIEQGTFEGQKEVKTDNVSICCLKHKNVFTEVFKFKTRKMMFSSKSLGLTGRNQKKSTNKENNESNNNNEDE